MDVVMIFVVSIITPKTDPFVSMNIFGMSIYMFSFNIWIRIIQSIKKKNKNNVYPVHVLRSVYIVRGFSHLP